MIPILRLLTALLLLPLASLQADTSAAQREQVGALGQLTSAPEFHKAEGFTDSDGMRPVFFDALPYQGKPTRVFAWLGMPPKTTGKVPAMVLVHGGGGTAHKEWVRLWNEHGFAAISIAVEGQTDEVVPNADQGKRWKKHAWAGPSRNGIYGDSAEPLEDQWMYHAVADCILAHSLLHSLPEVDDGKIGLMGFSWGGVITSTVIGIDSRFAFAIPVYGCGHLAESENQYGKALGENELYHKVWDPMVRMDRVKMPVLWFSWPEDKHFALENLAATYEAAPGPRMIALVPKLGHSGAASWKSPLSYAFAENIVTKGKPWCRQTLVQDEVGTARANFVSDKPLEKAVLVSTKDNGFTGDRVWIESAATLERNGGEWRAKATLPAGTTAWFINVQSGEFTASSDYQESKKKAHCAAKQLFLLHLGLPRKARHLRLVSRVRQTTRSAAG